MQEAPKKTTTKTPPKAARKKPDPKPAWLSEIEKADATNVLSLLDRFPSRCFVKLFYNYEGKDAHVSTMTVEDLPLNVEGHLQQEYGGGIWRLQFFTDSGKYVRQVTINLLGAIKPKLQSMLKIQPTAGGRFAEPTESKSELGQVKAELEALKRQRERDEIISAVQSENQVLREEMKGFLSRFSDTQTSPPQTQWAETFGTIGAAIIGILPTLTQKDENPLLMELLKKRMSGEDMIETARSFLETARELMPQAATAPPVQTTQPNFLDSLIAQLGPALLNQTQNQHPPVAGSDNGTPASAPAAPLRSNPDPYPQTQVQLSQIQKLITNRAQPDVIASQLIEAYTVAMNENAIQELFPELLNVTGDPVQAFNSFISRFAGLDGLDGQTYREDIASALLLIVGQPNDGHGTPIEQV